MPGLLTSPLRDRFGIVQRLEFYNVDDLERIVTRSAGILEVPIERAGARRIAQRSRGTPRIANRLLRRVRDYAQVKADGRVNDAVAKAALDMLEVDPQGFDALDRKFLLTIIEKFDGGPVGIESIAAAVGEERGTLEDVIEPFLIQQGFLHAHRARPHGLAHGVPALRPQGARASRPEPGPLRGQPVKGFSWPARVYWEDTDGGGVVYYANYLKYLERARSEWLRSLGFVQSELVKDPGVIFVVTNINIDYRRPARLDDSLLITCEYVPEGAASMSFAQQILRDGEVLIEGTVRVACLDAQSFRPKRLPPALVNAFAEKEPA